MKKLKKILFLSLCIIGALALLSGGKAEWRETLDIQGLVQIAQPVADLEVPTSLSGADFGKPVTQERQGPGDSQDPFAEAEPEPTVGDGREQGAVGELEESGDSSDPRPAGGAEDNGSTGEESPAPAVSSGSNSGDSSADHSANSASDSSSDGSSSTTSSDSSSSNTSDASSGDSSGGSSGEAE